MGHRDSPPMGDGSGGVWWANKGGGSAGRRCAAQFYISISKRLTTRPIVWAVGAAALSSPTFHSTCRQHKNSKNNLRSLQIAQRRPQIIPERLDRIDGQMIFV